MVFLAKPTCLAQGPGGRDVELHRFGRRLSGTEPRIEERPNHLHLIRVEAQPVDCFLRHSERRLRIAAIILSALATNPCKEARSSSRPPKSFSGSVWAQQLRTRSASPKTDLMSLEPSVISPR